MDTLHALGGGVIVTLVTVVGVLWKKLNDKEKQIEQLHEKREQDFREMLKIMDDDNG